jgi:hypothetical protein
MHAAGPAPDRHVDGLALDELQRLVGLPIRHEPTPPDSIFPETP